MVEKNNVSPTDRENSDHAIASRGVFAMLVIDDLDARDDPTRSARLSTYSLTAEEIAQVMAIIRSHKESEMQNNIASQD